MENNHSNQNGNTPKSAHPDPTTPNQAQGIKDEKNKTAPVSAHPDPVVPHVEEKVAHDQKEHHDHPHHEAKTPGVHTPTHEANKQTNEVKGSEESMNGEVTYDDKVIQKIIAIALERIDGLLTVDGGFFSNVAGKLVNTDNETAGIETEVGKKQVAVDMSIVVEYGKDIEDIFKQMKEIISEEVANMTHLDVIEVNVNVTDIKSKEEFEQDQVTVQDKVTDAAKATGEFASEQTDKAKHAASKGTEKVKENNEPRVQ
ncbi:Asp23/Gls24 family envelope stress response protein [Enterococcus mundtii]|uniref:Stress response regulator gls24 homolog n=1 Tax=Enterococcus mundtii TaxID=53346 RepID=A0AAI8R6Y5_ENTMU|nr:Asp23/Gls24 family envelope stress response protein [Enterococcus mundtii]BAO07049.1 general stress protein Gls33 [Enterococcus mundtii QU 25]BBM13353.1 general stress protein Gls33 [Enterococcus mundtii]